MQCQQCGTENTGGAQFCQNCGASLGGANPAPGARPQAAAPSYTATQPEVSGEYKPISMWGYFGYEILFAIPLVGFILLLVFSFGGTRNKNLKNFARSYFCIYIILAIVLIIILLTGGLSALLQSAY